MSKDYVPAFNYDFLTPFYDFFLELLGYGKTQRTKVIDLLNLKSADNLLDLGCGTGTLLILAKQRFPQIKMTGIDVDPKVLNIARNKTQKAKLEIEYLEASSGRLPFTDSSFGVVVSSLVFHHLPTAVKKQTIKEVYRILKKGGRFLLADFGKRAGIILNFLDFITSLLRLPESKTLQDNLNGKLPIFLTDEGFKVQEIAYSYKGIHFFEAEKL
jgi:ubiquinone/menaquinone biosynthesis C-methylase UbiE